MGDEEVDVTLGHFLMCLNFSLIGVLREEIGGVLNTSCVLLRNLTLEEVQDSSE